MTETEPCCRACAGPPPHKMCQVRHKCTCHTKRDAIAEKKHNALTYRDSTARRAVNNVMRERGQNDHIYKAS